MSALPESAERLFVLEKLSAARKTLSKGCAELLTIFPARRNAIWSFKGRKSVSFRLCVTLSLRCWKQMTTRWPRQPESYTRGSLALTL